MLLSSSLFPHFLSDSSLPLHPSFVWSFVSSCSWYLFYPVSFPRALLLAVVCVCLYLWGCYIYSEASPAPVCQSCLEKNYGRPFSSSAKAGRDHSKVVTFGGVTEIEQPVEPVTSSKGEESELLRPLFSKATVAMPVVDLGSRLSEREHRYGRGQIEDNLGCSGTNSTWLALVWTVLVNK